MKPAKDSSRGRALPLTRREGERALPLEERLYTRLLRAWATDRAKAERALAGLIGSQAHIAAQDAFLTRLPLPLAQAGRRLVRQVEACHAAHERKTRITAAIAESEQAARRAAALAALITRLAELSPTDRVRELAGLDPEERDRLTTGIERQAVLDLRGRALTTSQVRAVLACSVAELNRWSRDGRLEPLFTRRMRVHRLVTARFWESDRVREAAQHLANWRDQDRIRRTFQRTGLRQVPRSI